MAVPMNKSITNIEFVNNGLAVANARNLNGNGFKGYFRKCQLFGVRIRCVKVEGNSTYIFCVTGSYADVLYGIFVDLVNCHIKTKVIGSRMFDIFPVMS